MITDVRLIVTFESLLTYKDSVESACNAGNPGLIPGLGRFTREGDRLPTPVYLGSPCGSAGKESACNVGDLGLIPGLGRSPGEVKVTQWCPTLCDPMDYTVHGILQARILEWVAFPFSRGSSQPRDQTQVSHIAGRFFTS